LFDDIFIIPCCRLYNPTTAGGTRLEAESVRGPFVIGNGAVFGDVDFLTAMDTSECGVVITASSDVGFWCESLNQVSIRVDGPVDIICFCLRFGVGTAEVGECSRFGHEISHLNRELETLARRLLGRRCALGAAEDLRVESSEGEAPIAG